MNQNQKIPTNTLYLPNTSGYWNLTGTDIYIDGNADWASIAASEPWCSGTGTWDNPYIIENILIDGKNVDGTNLIEIRDSTKYFTIQNCTLIKAGSAGPVSYNSAIRLRNVNNGTLLNNTLSQNGYNGLTLENCINVTISGNSIDLNGKNGIYMYALSENNTIIHNKLNNNNLEEVYLNSSNNNTLSDNVITNQFDLISSSGIFIESCENNTIIRNEIRNQTTNGIRIENSYNERVLENNLTENSMGVYLKNCNNSLISHNTAKGSQYIGIALEACNFSEISNNYVYNNVEGITTTRCQNCFIYNNNVHHNDVSGIGLSTNSVYIDVKFNLANYNYYGIKLYESHNNTISNNSINYNERGVHLSWYSDFNNITGNHLICNDECIFDGSDRTGNIIKYNDCEECPISPNIPGYDLSIIYAVIGIISIIFVIINLRRRFQG